MNVRKRGLALLMCICMIFTLLPFSALADATTQDVVYGTYGADGKWREDKTLTAESSVKHYPADGETSDSKANIDYSKTAVKNDDGSYNVTLTIKSKTSETAPGASAVVLVIDISTSMEYCAECGSDRHIRGCKYYASGWGADNSVKSDQTRLAAAKEAAVSFVKDYAGNNKNSGRNLKIVSFQGYGYINTASWLDVSNSDAKQTAISTINSLKPIYYPGNGTNLEQGLSKAKDCISSAPNGIANNNKFAVVLTDGAPNRYGSNSSGEWASDRTIYNKTIATAKMLKAACSVYTVCFGASNDTFNGSTVGNFLKNDIASNTSYAFDADNSEDLNNAFKSIFKSIEQGISSGFTVTDPMGPYVTLNSQSLTDSTIPNGTITWKPKNGDTVTNDDGSKTTTYTLTYKVTLGEVPENGTYPLNEDTTLKFMDGDTEKTLQFNVPGVYREAPKYTVTYQYTGDAPEGAPLPSDNTQYKKGDPVTVKDAPTLDGYTFSGWTPTTESNVTIENGKFEMPANNVVLEGSWTKLEGYTVKYMWGDTVLDTKAGAALAVGMNTPNESPKSIEGYTPKSNDPKSITISTDPNENVIIFEYYKNVTLTANSKTVAYNGETQSISGYTCSVAGVTFEGIEVGAEGKDVGDYPAVFPDETVGTVDTTDKYIVAVANSGMLTIYKATDAMATIKATKTLDNDAPGSVQFSFKLESTDGKDTRTIPNATNAPDGRIKFDLTYDKEGTYIYKLSEVKGTDTGIVYDETVYYVKVEVKLVDKTYNAEVSYFKDEACTVSPTTDLPTFNNTTKTGSLIISKVVAGNAADKNKEFTFTLTLSENGEIMPGEVEYGGFTFEDGKYTFKLKNGGDEIFTGLPVGTTYTITESDNSGYTVSAEVSTTGGYEPMKVTDNAVSGTIIEHNTDVKFTNTKNSTPVNPGIYTEITVEITGNSDSVVYDGTEHSVKDYTVKISDPRYTEADFTFTGKAEAGGVNAGTYEMGLKAEQFKNTNARFTNVKFVIKADGVLTITPKELTITAGSKTEYGPTPVTCGDWTVSGLVAGDKVESVKITGIQSVPGSSPNVPSDAVIKNAKGEDVTKNYAIKYVNGTLTMLEVLNKEDHFNYIIGTPEGLSLPTANVTRAEVATIFFRLMTDDARAKFDSLDNNFSDVAKGKWYNRAISTLANAGIIKGDPAGTYRPGDPITRAEMAAIIARFGDFKEGGKTFSDISGHWAQKYIELAASNGWINGNPDGTFKPNNNITRAETVAMINRVLNRQTESNDDLLPVSQMTNWSDNMDTAKWYYRDMQEATNNHKAERVGDSIYEKWTEKLPDIDWASYQI